MFLFFHIFFVQYLLKVFLFDCRYWLFGEKVQGAKQKKDANGLKNEKEKLDATKNVRIRGWFPRKCAVELVDPDSDDEHEHFTAKKTN